MPAPVQESLVALAGTIAAQLNPGASLGVFDITLAAPNALTVPNTSTVKTVTDGKVDLTLVMKNVRFVDTDPLTTATVGGMPIQQFATQLLNGGAGVPGVPGLLASLLGTVPVVVDEIGGGLDVQVQVRMTVRDEKGLLDPYVNWRFSTGSADVGAVGESAPGTALPSLNLFWRLPVPNSAFVAAFTGMTAPIGRTLAPALVARSVTLEVNLSAAGVSSGWIALPPIPLKIPAIPIPTIVACFDDVVFNTTSGRNGTVILLPDGSPLMPAGPIDDAFRMVLATALGVISSQVKGLVSDATGTGGFNPFNPLAPLASVIDNLVNDLTNPKLAKQIHFYTQSMTPHLGDLKISGGDSAQDCLSSILAIGPAGLVVHCFNNANFDGSEGAFDLRTGIEMAVAVSSLTPSTPPSYPPGNVTVTTPRSTFNDCLSSIQIVES